MSIRQALLIIVLISFHKSAVAQEKSAAGVLSEVKKLSVFGSVLYVAAHPDDENTRLLSYFANEKRYRTGYLSLTRGDGGQNLIGDEQGIDLGMIRTQELLAARSVDGAEQFFTRAYDFGYSKSPEEALRIWGHEKILSDVVWAIRKFRPDVIICRFPATGEGGHGHHTASAILASEAFDAAADASRFPEQLTKGVSTWKARRLLWNTFNFGNTNTQRDDQFKLDVGMYNPLLGLGYGEMSAESRSKHSSQGFGVPAQRGTALEYFTTIKGSEPRDDLFDGVDTSPSRLKYRDRSQAKSFGEMLLALERNFSVQHPQASVPSLLSLRRLVSEMPEQEDGSWKERYTSQLTSLILRCGGIFTEVVAKEQLNILGDSATFSAGIVNRLGLNVSNVNIRFAGASFSWPDAPVNRLLVKSATIKIPADMPRGNPFWLQGGLPNGAFEIEEQERRVLAAVTPHFANVEMMLNEVKLSFTVPVQYKYVEPTRGEIYQPVYFVDAVNIVAEPGLEINNSTYHNSTKPGFRLKFNKAVNDKVKFTVINKGRTRVVFDSIINVKAGSSFRVPFEPFGNPSGDRSVYYAELSGAAFPVPQVNAMRKISYPHIPEQVIQQRDSVKIVSAEFAVKGSRVGYIRGAGDKVPEALHAMGYIVDFLGEVDITPGNLKKYDAIVTGIRAYNVHDWLENVQPVLMNYVDQGGVMLVQYNTNSNVGPLRTKISPYPFSISRLRITDENAAVNFLEPDHAILNYPNKITAQDFEGWVQERSVYHADKVDAAYKKIFSMRDPGSKEEDLDGSLIAADFGSGRFIYTGLAFFRQLPAGVPGAYRLLANLLAKPQSKK